MHTQPDYTFFLKGEHGEREQRRRTKTGRVECQLKNIIVVNDAAPFGVFLLHVEKINDVVCANLHGNRAS